MTNNRLVAIILSFPHATQNVWSAKFLSPQSSISPTFLASIFLVIFSLPGQVFCQIEEENWNRSELVFGSQVPRNRERERQIEATEKLISAGRYSDSVRMLQSLLESPDDSILMNQTSLKAKATQLLAELPASGKRALQTIVEVPLDKEIQRAIDEQDRFGLAELAARNPPEALGKKAWIAWAWLEREHGNQLFASAIIQELESSNVTINEAPELVEDLLESHQLFVDRYNQVKQNHQKNALPRWLRRHSPENWMASQAGADRQFQMQGPRSTPWRNWSASTKETIGDEREIEAVRSRLTDSFSQLTAPNAIAVDGNILFREGNHLIAIDAATGLRKWNASLAMQEGSSNSFDRSTHYYRNLFATQTTQRAWLDRSRGAISSDSELVFTVVDVRQPDEESGQDAQFFPWHRTSQRDVVNAIAAFSIAEQGKRKWMIDGSDSSSPYFGFRFLGSPTAVEDYLAILAERQGAVSFLLVNARDGELLWQQPISNRESNEFLPHLTLTGYSPIWNDGKFYCSAGAGIVAAINPMRRSIDWIRYLPVDETLQIMQMRRSQQIGLRQAERRIRSGEGWRSTSLYAYRNKLVVAPVESSRLACFDLTSGNLLWSVEPKQGNLVVGIARDEAIDQGQVLVLESHGISSRSLESGEELWREMLLGEEQPVGEGVQVGDHYLIPLNSGRFAYVPLKKGADQEVEYERLLSGPLQNPVSLGNLFWHQGAIYSRSPTSVEKFIQPVKTSEVLYQADRALSKGDYLQADQLLEEQSRSGNLSEVDRLSRRDMAIGLATLAGDRDKLLSSEASWSFSDRLQNMYPFKTSLLDFYSAIESDLLNESELNATARKLLQMPEAKQTLLAISHKHQVRADRWIKGKLIDNQIDDSPNEVNFANAIHPFSMKWQSNQVFTDRWGVANHELSASQNGYYYSRQRNNISRTLPIRSSKESYLTWRYISNGNDQPKIICRDQRGEICFSRTMEDSLRTNFQSVNLGQPSPCYWNDMLYVQLDDSLQAIDVRSIDKSQSLIWTYDSAIFIDYQTIRFYDPTTVSKSTMTSGRKTNSNQVVPSIYWVDADGAVIRAGGKILALDPRSGELLWSQNDWKSYDRLFVHEDRIYLGKTGSTGKGKVLDKSDGRLVGEWYVPGNSWRLYYAGKLLVSNRSEMKLYDIAKQERTPIWTAPLAGNQYALLEDQIFLLDANRELTCFDLTKGRVRFQITLEENLPKGRVKSLSCFLRGDNFYVGLSTKNNTDLRQKGITPIGQSPLIAGSVYCLDAETGKSVWPQPIELNGMALLDNLLANSPLLVFASKKQKNEIDSNQGDYRVLVANRWTGATLYRSDNLPGERQSYVNICELVEQSPAEAITLQVGRSQMRFEVTDAARPPQSPAMASVERHEPNNIGLTEFGEGIKKIFGGMTEPIEK